MRIVRVKPSQEVKEYLKNLAKTYGIKDAGLVVDIFGIVRFGGNGLPDENRTEAIVKAYAMKTQQSELLVGLVVRKRLIVLKNIMSTPLFAGLVSGGYDPIDAVEKLLSVFSELHMKKQAYQCTACKYLKNCKFGSKYHNVVTDISKVRDTDYKAEVHPNCPAMPELDFVNSVDEARKFFESVMDEERAPETELAKKDGYGSKDQLEYMQDPSMVSELDLMQGGVETDTEKDMVDLGDVDSFDDFQEFAEFAPGGYSRGNSSSVYKFDGRYCVGVSEELVKNLSATDFALYELAQKLDFLLGKHKKGKFAPTEELGKDKAQDTVKKISDVPKVLPSEHAVDDETFNIRLSRKTLAKRQERNPQKKRALLYVLLDSSGSIFAGVTSKLQFISRFNMGRVFTLALARRLKADNGIMYWRAFSDYPGVMLTMDSDKSYTEFGTKMVKMSPLSGGTNIERCLRQAMDDILQAKDHLSKAEILMITDAEDHITQGPLEKQLKRWPTNILHVLDVSGKGKKGSSFGNASSVLKNIANEYYYVDPTAGLDLEKIVAIV